MTKTSKVHLVAKTLLRHDGGLRGAGQRFFAEPDEAKTFVDAGQAEHVVDETPAVEQETPAAKQAKK